MVSGTCDHKRDGGTGVSTVNDDGFSGSLRILSGLFGELIAFGGDLPVGVDVAGISIDVECASIKIVRLIRCRWLSHDSAGDECSR